MKLRWSGREKILRNKISDPKGIVKTPESFRCVLSIRLTNQMRIIGVRGSGSQSLLKHYI